MHCCSHAMLSLLGLLGLLKDQYSSADATAVLAPNYHVRGMQSKKLNAVATAESLQLGIALLRA